MSKGGWYFHYQVEGKESKWELELSEERDRVVRTVKPAFTTVLDMSAAPADNDWSKVRYRGPFYADFDADGDIELACEKFQEFLGKLHAELDFDVEQARLYATGGKGFHLEIPADCFFVKLPQQGTAWLPYIYRSMAEQLMVDTLDLNVYTGKRGRQWRTPNVKRENGCYKVPLTVEEALAMTPELYAELVAEPREVPQPVPASCNSRFAMLFDRSKERMQQHMRGKKKRAEVANALLAPWKKASRTPPSIDRIMQGEELRDDAGFQAIAMQLAIYATSVEMSEDEFVDRCQGLVKNHVSDGTRYGTPDRRRAELRRMHQYMAENSLYEFETAPVVRLLKPGSDVSDLGVMQDTDDDGNVIDKTQTNDDGEVVADVHRALRKKLVLRHDGIFVNRDDGVESLCRAAFKELESLYDAETKDFRGFAFDLLAGDYLKHGATMSHDIFTSSQKMRAYFSGHGLSYQGSDAETAALMELLNERADKHSKRVYTYPREGLFVLSHPDDARKGTVSVYLTQTAYFCSIPEGQPDHFRLKYKPNMAMSSYNIDIHEADVLGEEHRETLHDLFGFSRANVLASLLGWFMAAHYRSFYLHLFKQFPLLHVYGEAGSGKTKTIETLCHLHWYRDDRINIRSAVASTPFALDMLASSSTSAPLVLDEYKPREMRLQRGKHEKLKDIFKASYVGSNVGERGTLNKGADNALSVVTSKATAPIVFMAEAVEMETAIIERCVPVQLAKSYQTKRRRMAFDSLNSNPGALSAIGRLAVEMGFRINLDAMKEEVQEIRRKVEASLPDLDDMSRKRPAERQIFNRVVVIHGLTILQRLLASVFKTEFDEEVGELITAAYEFQQEIDTGTISVSSMSEISKVMSRIAMLTRAAGRDYEIVYGKDYLAVGDHIELKVERAYDCYRRYCATIHETPLFDTLEAYLYALNAYSAVTDHQCPTSVLAEDGERVIRFDLSILKREGVSQFRA